MPPKERKKGQKEIHKTNIDTLDFYWKFSICGTAIQVTHLLLYFLLASSFSKWNYFFLVFSVGVQYASYRILCGMFTPVFGENGQLLDAGVDLMDSYFSEYAIDTIILTSIVQGLSAISNYFWILWLAAPGYIGYKVWTMLIWPWFTAGNPLADGEDRGSSKKQKRPKMKRMM